MWPELDARTEAWRARCAEFAERVILPNRRQYDRENRFPEAVHEVARAEGMLNLDFPEELGGGGLSSVEAVVGVETLASVCAPIAFTMGFNRGALHPILVGANDDQKQEFIGKLIAEGRYASLCLTEPHSSGSNLMGLNTTATRTDRGWMITGEKCMVGNGGVSTQFSVLAKTVVDGKNQGLSFFAVPKSDAVIVSENTDKLGFRAVETPTIRFVGAEVEPHHRIGATGSGAALMIDTLHAIRVGGSATILGIVVGALNDALPWVSEREVYGGKLVTKSHVQLVLGGLYAELEMVRRMVYESARLRDEGKPFGHASSIAKLHAAELAKKATTEVSQLFGWRGIDGDYPIQKRYRDARQTSIFEGTSEVQRMSIFHTLMSRHSRGEAL
ncbi:MAG: hypothetical protein EP330_26530 [Deltaproteobacteria bacterium]|nr:MAG: hypothetical protein EP330_26530 [Deltaproteobacteria bacterium]